MVVDLDIHNGPEESQQEDRMSRRGNSIYFRENDERVHKLLLIVMIWNDNVWWVHYVREGRFYEICVFERFLMILLINFLSVFYSCFLVKKKQSIIVKVHGANVLNHKMRIFSQFEPIELEVMATLF